jgi:hypothetical protein
MKHSRRKEKLSTHSSLPPRAAKIQQKSRYSVFKFKKVKDCPWNKGYIAFSLSHSR